MIRALDFLPAMLDGAKTTIGLFLVTALISIPIGFIIAVIRFYGGKIVKSIIGFYILVMRGTPLLLQIIFVFFGLPMMGIVLERLPSAIIAFAVNYAAYMAEIFRGGIESIDKGQFENAKILGFNKIQTFRFIIMPQVMKRVLPSIGNEMMALIKDTSLVYVIGLGEILRAAKNATNMMASVAPMVLAAGLYLVLIGILTIVMKLWEKKYAYYKN
ncbi:MAG: amino acid ABC transporter permease [Clostridiaceae bacterium]